MKPDTLKLPEEKEGAHFKIDRDKVFLNVNSIAQEIG